MASENQMSDTTSFQQSGNPILCANSCGFFGTPATMNLCSKCYRDHKTREEQAASAMPAVEKSMSSVPPLSAPPKDVVVEPLISDGVEKAMEVEEAPPNTKAANRCGSCNKKVGITGFKCRCGITFCGSHRYAEEHKCLFDFKGAGRDAIAKANPLVKADKMEKF